jgi:hypothetical protein
MQPTQKISDTLEVQPDAEKALYCAGPTPNYWQGRVKILGCKELDIRLTSKNCKRLVQITNFSLNTSYNTHLTAVYHVAHVGDLFYLLAATQWWFCVHFAFCARAK